MLTKHNAQRSIDYDQVDDKGRGRGDREVAGHAFANAMPPELGPRVCAGSTRGWHNPTSQGDRPRTGPIAAYAHTCSIGESLDLPLEDPLEDPLERP